MDRGVQNPELCEGPEIFERSFNVGIGLSLISTDDCDRLFFRWHPRGGRREIFI